MRSLVLFMVLLLPATSWATSFVLGPQTEDNMIETADVIARVRVGGIKSVKTDLGDGAYAINTEITLNPVKCLKGCRSDQGPLLIYEAGGSVGDTTAGLVDSPVYVKGQERLVFLSKQEDGTLRTKNLGLGSVPMFTDRGGTLRLSASRVIEEDSFAGFQERLRKKIGLQAPARPLEFKTTELQGEAQQNNSFRWLGNPGSKWRDLPIQVVLPTVGEALMGPVESEKAILSAFNAWEGIPTSSIDFDMANKQTPQGFICQPGKLLVSFDDPLNQIDDPQGCGGVLAIGGFCGSGVTLADGFQSITAGAYVSNNGWGGCGFWSAQDHKNFDEVSTHELGHAIGFAHSRESGETATTEERDATMYWMAHFDGRGGGVRAYDIGAASTLYPGAATPTASPSPAPTASPKPTVAPTASPKPTASPMPTSSPDGKPTCPDGGFINRGGKCACKDGKVYNKARCTTPRPELVAGVNHQGCKCVDPTPAPSPTPKPKCGQNKDAVALFVFLGIATIFNRRRR